MNSYQNPNFPQIDQAPPTPSATIGYPGYQQPQFQQQQQYVPQIPPQIGYPSYQVPQLPLVPYEESYIENILRLNKDKIATVYMNFDNSQWGSKIFKGAIEAAGKDHLILRDPVTQMRYLLLSIYLNYITFDEEINYEYPLVAPSYPGLASYNIPTPGYQEGTAPPSFNIPNVPPTTQYRKKESNKENKK